MKKSLRFEILIFTAARVVQNTLFRMIFPFLPVIARGLGVSFVRISQALTWRALAGVFGVFAASIADSRGRKAGLLFGLVLFIMGLAVVIFYPTFYGFAIMLVFTMLGKSVYDPSMQAYLGDHVPYQRRARVLAITELGWSGAFLIGVPVIGLIISWAGWLAPFPLLLGLSLISLVIIYWSIPSDLPHNPGRLKIFENFNMIFSSRSAMMVLAVTFLISLASDLITLVFGVWLDDIFGLQVAALGAASAVIGFAELSGEGIVGTISDRFGKKRAVAFGLLASSLAAALLPVVGYNIPGALVGLFFFYLFIEFSYVSLVPIMTEILPSARATLMAFNIATTSLGRAVAAWIGPFLYIIGFEINAWTSATVSLTTLLFLHYVIVNTSE